MCPPSTVCFHVLDTLPWWKKEGKQLPWFSLVLSESHAPPVSRGSKYPPCGFLRQPPWCLLEAAQRSVGITARENERDEADHLLFPVPDNTNEEEGAIQKEKEKRCVPLRHRFCHHSFPLFALSRLASP
jgi:hypothetical protein